MKSEIPFDCSDYRVEGHTLSYLDSGGDKPLLHFSHANGFPVSMYLPLMEKLSLDFRVLGLSLRGQDGLSQGILNWQRLATDLAGFLDTLSARSFVGVGHSIGAVTTLFCAARRPDLFSRIILLDPPLFSARLVFKIRLMRLLGQKRRFPPALRARRRHDGWEDRGQALDYFRRKDLFSGWEEVFLRAYVTYGLRPDPDGRMMLLCPPEAEARAFENYPVDVWSWVKKVRTPVLLVRGGNSEILSRDCCERFCRLCPTAQLLTVPGSSHFIPMQQSSDTIRLIRDFSSM